MKNDRECFVKSWLPINDFPLPPGTNTWLVGNGESKVLIDTGEGFSAEKYVKFLLETVFPLTKTKNISMVLLTHGHGDHLGGVTTLLKELKKLGQPPPKVYKRQVLNGKYPSVGFVCEHISDGQCFNASENSDTERIEIKSVYSAGHTDDHVAFTLQVRQISSNAGLCSGAHPQPFIISHQVSMESSQVKLISSERLTQTSMLRNI